MGYRKIISRQHNHKLQATNLIDQNEQKQKLIIS